MPAKKSARFLRAGQIFYFSVGDFWREIDAQGTPVQRRETLRHHR
jgi:hypothetical protein